ncbi:TPM domain-containing protein [Pseudonocardia benzenivorans]
MSAGLASADAPLRAADRITDRANALDASGRAQVTDAIARLRTDTGYDLFVVYVRSFDGRSGEDWAHATAVQSQLGARDVLLAVATDDGAYGYSVEDGFPVPVDTIAAEQVEPKLAARDWSGAAVAMANGLRTGGSSGTGALPLVIGGVVIVGGGAWLLTRRRRSAVTTSEATTPAGAPQQPAGPPDPFPGESTEDLGYRSSQALIAVDDAVRTSEQELSAARAHFGEEPVAPFAAALDASRADMLAAFEIRQQLDDDVPEDEPTQRRMHAEILRLATAADERLDAQVEAFDRLRGLEADAPGYVEGVASRVAAATGSVATVEAAWDELRRRWAATSLEPVAGNLDQAKALLADAATEIAEARARLATPPQAVVDGRAAEDAVTQAETLLAGVERRDRELVEAAGRIPAARAEVEQDLAEAATLPSADRAVVARARAALDAAAAAADAPCPTPSPRCTCWRRPTPLSTGRSPTPASSRTATGAPPRPSTRSSSPRARPSPPPRTSSRPGAAPSARRPGPGSRRRSGTCRPRPPAATPPSRCARRSRRSRWPSRRCSSRRPTSRAGRGPPAGAAARPSSWAAWSSEASCPAPCAAAGLPRRGLRRRFRGRRPRRPVPRQLRRLRLPRPPRRWRPLLTTPAKGVAAATDDRPAEIAAVELARRPGAPVLGAAHRPDGDAQVALDPTARNPSAAHQPDEDAQVALDPPRATPTLHISRTRTPRLRSTHRAGSTGSDRVGRARPTPGGSGSSDARRVGRGEPVRPGRRPRPAGSRR